MTNRKRHILHGCTFLAAFTLWTALVCTADVEAIGPLQSTVGMAAMNQFIHRLTGVHLDLYVITDWLSIIPLLICFAFAALGLLQWIKRCHILRVDHSILVLGGFYLVVFAFYLFFEFNVINYRPVLIDGILEASYPSSTTVLVLCVMGTAAIQLNQRLRNVHAKRWLSLAIGIFTALMVVGRLISGVHWLSDIIGSILLSFSLISFYIAFS